MTDKSADTGGFDPAAQVSALGQAVIATDLDGVVVDWNPAAEELYGWTAAEAVGHPVSELTVPEVEQAVAEQIMAAVRQGQSWSGGFRVRRKDGTTFHALVTDTGIYRDGRLVGIIGVSANLAAALGPLLDRSTDAALLLRADGTVSYASPAARQVFDWPDEALVGRSVVPLLHPDDREALADFLEQVVRHPGAHPPLELRVRSRDTWVWVDAALTNLLDDLSVHGVICTLRLAARRDALTRAETRSAQLQAALDSRVAIEQAKGFLAGRCGIELDTAFQRLRRYARTNQVDVHRVALALLDHTLGVDDVNEEGGTSP